MPLFETADTSWPWSWFKYVDPMSVMAGSDMMEKKTTVFKQVAVYGFWNKPAAISYWLAAEVVDWRGRMPVGLDAIQREFDEIGEKLVVLKNKTLSINANSITCTHGFRDLCLGEVSNSGSG
jgi:hypothetical protein